jgi:uncharacterized SAM-binding protein YcdF (DUF218 family)
MKIRFFLLALTGMLSLLSSCVFIAAHRAPRLFAQAQSKAPYDAIIVPGVPYDSSFGKWSDIMKIRMYWSHYLYTQGMTKNIIFSGSAVYTPYIEAKIMAMYAEQMGIPKECIHVDTCAEHSTENLYYSYYLAQKKGFTKIAVATDPFQAYMLKSFPKKVHIQVDFIPMVFKTMNTMAMSDFTIEPELARMEKFVALPLRENFWKRLKGTMGKNIRPVPEDPRFTLQVQPVKSTLD